VSPNYRGRAKAGEAKFSKKKKSAKGVVTTSRKTIFGKIDCGRKQCKGRAGIDNQVAASQETNEGRKRGTVWFY